LLTARLVALAAALVLAACATTPEVPHRASVRVAFDQKGVTGTRVAGEAAPGRKATADDPVRIASVSKLVAALGVMRMVEAGTLDLDRDVSDYLGWRLRNPAFPDAPVTLRLLLSHTSSLTDAGDYVVPLGVTLRDFIGAKSWDGEHAPGAFFRYSNLNFPVIASVIEHASGERFDRLMTREVLAPLGLDAGYNWSGASDAAVARGVILRAPDGSAVRDDLGGKRPACPVVPAADGNCDLAVYGLGDNGALFSPQGGLRISANGLARVGRLLLGMGVLDGKRFLSEASIAELTRAHWRYDGGNGETDSGFYCGYGLAVQLITSESRCRDNPFTDGRARLGHAGDAYHLKSGLWIDPAAGEGVAYFVTAVADDAPKGRSAYRVEEEAMARR